MDKAFSHTQIKQFKQLIEEVIDEKFGENVLERLDKIERNTDAACKISSDDRQEITIIESKVDLHDKEIKELQEFTGFAAV